MNVNSYAKAAFGVLAGVVLTVGAAGCGSTAAATGGAGGGAAAPAKLPTGATLGCAEAVSTTCAYGGAASAPSGLKTVNINTKITPDMFKLTAPMAIATDASAPGGKYLAVPAGAGGGTSQLNGGADVAVNIPSDGYYVIMAGTQSGDTTTGTDSFFIGFDSAGPQPDHDHTWSLNPDGNWHKDDSTAGCVQIIHDGTNDAPNGCDTFHFKKGVLVIHLSGREDNSHVAYLDVVPANPAKPMGDARQ